MFSAKVSNEHMFKNLNGLLFDLSVILQLLSPVVNNDRPSVVLTTPVVWRQSRTGARRTILWRHSYFEWVAV